jgi:N-acetylgalactosamine-6-sulfatase
VVLSVVSLSAADQPLAASRPNVVFILLDDQGWGDAKSFGHPYMQTPNIDRLAAAATRFTQFYVANPVCSPSRTGFMTGHYPARHGVHQHFATHEQNAQRSMPDWLDPTVPTVCRLLKGAGYATAHFGKWHLGNGQGAPPPDAYGIDDHRTVNSSGPGWNEREPYFRAKSTGLIVNEAIRFIKAHKTQPFYVNVWTLVPHATLDPTPEELAVYKDLVVRREDFPSWMQEYVRNAKDPTEQMRVFCAAMTGLDRALGRLLDCLDSEGLADKTLIVFSSDNGPEDYHIGNAANAGMGSPGVMRGRKRSLYDGGLRTPLLVRWPGKVAAGRVDETSVLAAVDFLPSVCKLAGVDVTKLQLDGEDVSDIWVGQSRPRTKPIYWEWRGGVAGNPAYCPPRLAMRERNWRFFCDFDGSNAQLYDIPADPEERTDLAAQHADLVGRFKEQVLAWKKTLPEGPTEAPRFNVGAAQGNGPKVKGKASGGKKAQRK